ncbi:MAG TPA: alpha-amylase, partial [Geobacteraceae bacterium]
MNMLKMEENAKYRQTVKNVLEFDPEILKRFVNFMNNPDERTAVEQFGKEGKYFGACVLLVTMPGLPMIGHGQIEGYHEKYGMEYRRAFWDEPVDEHLLALHEQLIFPLMRRRWLFSGSQHFVFYDFFAGDHVNEDVFAYSNRQGAERGLVIYHNRFADTAGWVRSSTARAVKGEGGETRLVQQALGEALGFDGGDGVYYAFRDYASGLEYLRAGRELCERGLFVELTAYQYYAFLDFREIRDNGAGAWAELCRQLDGRAVVSLDEEVKQIRFAPLIARYRDLVLRLSTALSAPTTPVPAAEPSHEATAGLPGEWKAFIHLLGEAGLQVEPQASLAALRRGVALFGRLRAAEPAEGTAPQTGQAPGILPVSARDQALAAALLLLGVVVAACPESSDWVATYGLGRATADLFRDIPPAPDESASLDPEAAACLLRLLLEYGNASGSPAVAGHTWSALLFSDPRARQFLFVHAASGVEWFNRERWELLCRWLCLTLLLRKALREAQEEALAEALDDVRQMLTALLAIADEAGYRVAAIAGET